MTRTRTGLAVLFSLGFLAGMAVRANADQWDQKTNFTFSAPVAIPGQTLPAGSYVFKLMDSPSDRDVVQIFSADGKHLYGTFLAIPDYRLHPAGKPIITFDERPAGSPEAVRGWFYPGDNFGHQFVYPKPEAAALAKANHAAVPSMSAGLAPNTMRPATTGKEPHVMAMRQAQLKAQMPTNEEGEVSEASTKPQPATKP